MIKQETSPRRIAVLGSTGSIGKQTLEVIRKHPDHFTLEVLTANHNADLLIAQALEHKPNAVVIGDEILYNHVNAALSPHFIKVYAGQKSLYQVVEMETIDLVMVALVGFAGLQPTINAIKSGKPVALANKETLVAGGELVTKLAAQHNVALLPVDSEHSAIFQCLAGEFHNPIEKIYLTASGGPFHEYTPDMLANIGIADALNHPNWQMGNKITIDCATLMNKGLEVIEASWLFNLPGSSIEVLVHPQSIVHSMVQFRDGSLKAQLGMPDMRLPIQYALGYPARLSNTWARLDFSRQTQLTFAPPDMETFPCLSLAYRALQKGGNMPCIMNAANEVAVDAFLASETGFLQIADIIEHAMLNITWINKPDLAQLIETDAETRKFAKQYIHRLKSSLNLS
ncbi:MAG: 1-deoxy-D-xylulose-5-phosphate reductoisomerase [Lentimicrobiaceae bacterium]|jgi:1-deoxy-D-xylulose-5-phosphate reductoisomerase|nr:1-deoxy-D-xylulose-5-phosphate reductoisomerase [Lentimicrobiaceae bacterium]